LPALEFGAILGGVFASKEMAVISETFTFYGKRYRLMPPGAYRGGKAWLIDWHDDAGKRHWKTEIVANHVEMLSGRRKKDYAAENAANGLAAQAATYGDDDPADDGEAAAIAAAAEPLTEADEEVVAA